MIKIQARFILYHNGIINIFNLDSAKNIPWNFAKFLVDQEGKVKHYYEPQIDPDNMKEDIEQMLKA